MTETLIDYEFWRLVLRFLFGSSLLLLAVLGLEKFGLARRIEVRAYLWKSALVGSILLLLPISLPQAPVIYLQSENLISGEPLQTIENTEPVLQAQTIADPGVEQSSDLTTPLVEDAALTSVSVAGSGETEAVIAPSLMADWLTNLNLSTWLLFVWFAISCFLAARLYFGYRIGMHRLGVRHEITEENSVWKQLNLLSSKAGLSKPPKLTCSKYTESPVTLVGNEICLPEWADESLPESELRSLLAHELAHVRHGDLQLLLGLQVLCCLFFFQPLFAVARNRLIDLSEFLADQSALNQCQNSNAITKTLVNCAERIHSRQNFQWGFTMVGNQSRLRQRILHLQSAGQQSLPRFNRASKTLISGSVCTLVLLVPTMQVDSAAATADASLVRPAADASDFNPAAITEITDTSSQLLSEPEDDPDIPSQSSSTVSYSQGDGRSGIFDIFRRSSRSGSTYDVNGNRHQWVWDEGEAEWRDEFMTNDSEDEIISITGDGFFEYRTENVRPRRRILVEADGSGVTTTYWIDGDETAFDDDARAWFHEVLVTLFRSTGVNAETRVLRMLGNTGPDTVIRELAFIRSDFVSRTYNFILLENATLTEDQIVDLLETHKSIGSDMEMRLTLVKLVSTQNLNTQSQAALMEVIKGIGSDLEMRTTVLSIVSEVESSETLVNSLFESTDSIGSDMEARLALSGIANSSAMTDSNWLALRDASRTIGSDFELRQLIASSIERAGSSTTGTLSLIQATNSIGSDFEQRYALSTIAEFGEMNDENWRALFEAAESIGSDTEMRFFVSNAIRIAPESEFVSDQALRSLRSIGSDFEMRAALQTIVEQGELAEESWQLAITQAEEMLGSSFERNSALRSISDNIPDSISLPSQFENRLN